MKKVDLVFRTIGERTSQIALELAKEHIQPQTVHLIENIRPFSKAVQTMLQIHYDCEYVVFMDADCLILENLRPFLDRNSYLYVDSFVLDRFRGHIHQGVHITHIDLVREMQQVAIPRQDEKYVLRPESRLRALALRKLKAHKHFKHFRIFHDFFQHYEDIFAKLCLRELRSRTPENFAQLEAARKYWLKFPEEIDFQVANIAIDFMRSKVPQSVDPDTLHHYIEDLPTFAAQEVPKLNLPSQPPLSWADIEGEAQKQWQWQLFSVPKAKSDRPVPSEPIVSPQPKIFGIGLSRTGTKSLTKALHILGIKTIHYPDDDTTLRELAEGNYNLSLLQHFDGITDITVSPFYPQLDDLFPQSKFILTVREKEEWLISLEKHWQGRPAFSDYSPDPLNNEIHMNIRRLLRSANYGCYEFSRHRLSYVYDHHYQSVLHYFQNRPQSLLVLDICNGDGWEKLCPFLDRPLVSFPFPFVKKQSALKALLSESEFSQKI
ncbi:MAG: sulfotransferase [Prochlorotrichaceae cyanobacterium]|jgi:hypothetical protein